jgi:hypothetical protein
MNSPTENRDFIDSRWRHIEWLWSTTALSGRRVAATSLRSRIREFIRSGVVALKARPFDDPNKRTTKTDFRKSEGRLFCAGGRGPGRDVLSAYMPSSPTQITVVPPSTTNSMPLT